MKLPLALTFACFIVLAPMAEAAQTISSKNGTARVTSNKKLRALEQQQRDANAKADDEARIAAEVRRADCLKAHAEQQEAAAVDAIPTQPTSFREALTSAGKTHAAPARIPTSPMAAENPCDPAPVAAQAVPVSAPQKTPRSDFGGGLRSDRDILNKR